VKGVSDSDAERAEAARALGQQFAERRRELGLTQEQLAQRTGIGRNQIQNIERGYADRKSRRPHAFRLDTVVALCRELRLDARIDVANPVGLQIFYEGAASHSDAGDDGDGRGARSQGSRSTSDTT
jgi:transcriptional regulator with XRE-family HTH domain